MHTACQARTRARLATSALLALALFLAPLAAHATAALPTLALPVATLPSTELPTAGDELVRPGKWNPKTPPPGWVVIETSHYQVQSQCGKTKAGTLAAHLESMLDLYESFLPTRRKLDGFVLKLFKDRQAFLDYGAPPTAAAYYSPYDRELVAYDTGVILDKRDIPAAIGLKPGVADTFQEAERERLRVLFEQATDSYTMDTARVLSHEGWHQYFHFYTVSVVDMPAWLNEGIGDYFYMATRDEQQGDESGYRLGDINDIRLRTLRRAMSEGSTVSFETLLGFVQEQYYTNPGVFYAQGWSMVHFLMQHTDPKLQAVIPKLIKDFKDTKNFVKSTTKAFKGLSLPNLDREWIGWVLTTEPRDPLRDLAREFGTRLKGKDLQADQRWIGVYEWHLEHSVPATGTPAPVPGGTSPAAPATAPAAAPAAPAGTPQAPER